MSVNPRRQKREPAAPVYARDIAALVALAVVFRLPALLVDFWFDEILSYEMFARRARSIGDIFFSSALKHDNNHHLNTVALFLLGEQAHWIVYRVPAMICGLIAVGATVVMGNARSRLEGVLSGTLVSSSFLIVVYSTEARGYAWLLCATTIGVLALARFLDTRSRFARALFWASIVVGLASHGSIMQFYLGALLWSGYRLRAELKEFVGLHAVPVLSTIAWVVGVLRGAIVGGGPPWTWNQILDESLAWTFGYPLGTVPVAVAGLAAVALVVWDARHLWHEGSDEGLFYVGVILIPLVFMVALSPPYLFPRYFLVPLFFLLTVAGRRLAGVWAQSRRARWVVASALLFFVAGNAVHLSRLVNDRRGNHVAAVQLVAATQSDRVVITSFSLDGWTELPLQFYGRRLGVTDRIEYVRRGDVAGRLQRGDRVDWVIEPSQPCMPAAPTDLPGPSGGLYILKRTFPVCGPSGMTWSLYAPAE